MTSLAAHLVRPAKLNEVQSPGLLLRVGKYGAAFLIAGDKNDPDVIFLEGDYIYRSFKRSAAANWSGLAIENIEFELDLDSAQDVSRYGRALGSVIRTGSILTIAATPDERFSHTVDIPILQDLPHGSSDERTAFYAWKAFVTVGDERRVVWECKIPVERDW